MYRLLALVFSALGCVLFALTAAGPAEGQGAKEGPKSPLKFSAFVAQVKEAYFDDYKKAPGARVESRAAFKEMQSYLEARYKDFPVRHTFLSTTGQPIDCVPINQQPSLRHPLLAGHKVRLEPRAPPEVRLKEDGKAPGAAEYARLFLGKGQKDPQGNAMVAPPGTVPILRVTLADLVRFKTLKDFLRKHPSGRGRRPAPPAAAGTHRYAIGLQDVDNVGGTSWLNVWAPTPRANEFSLSQVWFMTTNPVQTVEGGWQVYPLKYGHNQPVLFIFWTADDYNKTGNYNLDAPAFVQTNSSVVLGGALKDISTAGGAQYGFQVTWFLDPDSNDWWLWLRTDGANTAVGYYPAALFQGGPLATKATRCEFGGEVTGSPSGQMGSGALANAGFGQAAFQKNIAYYADPKTATEVTLKPYQSHPACYTIDLHNSGSAKWGSYFYFGGPRCP